MANPTLIERKGTASYNKQLLGQRTYTRLFLMNCNDFADTYPVPASALNHPDLPKLGELFNVQGEVLVLTNIDAEYVQDSKFVYKVVLTYTERRGGNLAPSFPKRRISISGRSFRSTTDLDRKHIGEEFYYNSSGQLTSELDPDAEVGKDVIKFQQTLEIQMPDPIYFTVDVQTQLNGLLGKVNSEVFDSRYPPGTVQYMGYDMEEIGPEPGDSKLVHQLLVGYSEIPNGTDGYVVVPLDKDWVPKRYKTSSGAIDILGFTYFRLYNRADLNIIFNLGLVP